MRTVRSVLCAFALILSPLVLANDSESSFTLNTMSQVAKESEEGELLIMGYLSGIRDTLILVKVVQSRGEGSPETDCISSVNTGDAVVRLHAAALDNPTDLTAVWFMSHVVKTCELSPFVAQDESTVIDAAKHY